MTIRRSWLLILLQAATTFLPIHARPSLDDSSLTPRSSSELASTQFAQVGPIVAGVLGTSSALLLLLLVYRLRRRYKMRPGVTHKKQTPAKSRLLRLFGGKREPTPSSYWDDNSWQRDLEAFPEMRKIEPTSSRASAFEDRPLPTVPAIIRHSSPLDESEGAPPFHLRGPPMSLGLSFGNSSLNVENPSRTKLRVRPDPMLIQGVGRLAKPSGDELEERRRELAGSTPARRSYAEIPSPMPRPTNIQPPVPPGLGLRHGRSQSDIASSRQPATPAIVEHRPRSRSDGGISRLTDARSRHRSFSASILSPIQDGSSLTAAVSDARSTRMNRRQLTLSLYETQEAVATLEGLLSVSTIDIPPLTAHSRNFPSSNNTEHLHAEVEILRREIRRLQTLLLTSRRNEPSDRFETVADSEPHPPPVYIT